MENNRTLAYPDHMEQQIQRDLDDIVDGGIVGAIGLVEHEGEVTFATSGAMSVGGPPMRPDAIMRIQSMTKTVTAVATHRLAEAGRLPPAPSPSNSPQTPGWTRSPSYPSRTSPATAGATTTASWRSESCSPSGRCLGSAR